MNAIPKLLSKTKLMRGYRCMKCIYLTIHSPALEAPITPETQALFDQGNQVGEVARQYFPGGVLVDNVPWDFGGALAKTRALIASDVTVIYEAAFEYAGCYARTDILQKNPATNRWSIYEVKSSTKVKPEQLDDVALQAWIMAKSGLPIDKIHLVHLNNACRYPDLSNLFTTVDITNEVRERYLTVQPKIRDILTTLRDANTPDNDIGPHCLEPTECGFKNHCWQQKQLPTPSIFDLPNIHQRKWELYLQGILALDDNRLTDLTPLQQRAVDAFKSQQRFVDVDGIRAALSGWQYPLTFLDFETINPAIPRYHDTGPFQQVPFQFSVHRLTAPDAPLEHIEFLHEDASDPRPTLIHALLAACCHEGPIITYHSKFESDRIKELAAFAPQYAASLNSLNERIVDLLPVIRENVYDTAFNGRFGLKKVTPALLGEEQSYDEMAVANGNDAQRAFEALIAPHISLERKTSLRQAMLDYCRKDTLVMVDVLKWLYAHS